MEGFGRAQFDGSPESITADNMNGNCAAASFEEGRETMVISTKEHTYQRVNRILGGVSFSPLFC